jgi:hypothetical protein
VGDLSRLVLLIQRFDRYRKRLVYQDTNVKMLFTKSGLEPLIPIYQRGILYGNPNIREVSATALGEAIHITSAKFLAGPMIVKMTGPLLRIVGDRNPSNVKTSILKTLGLVLTKGGPALRAFVPQFQTT